MNSAHDLVARLAELLQRERAALAEFLLALADFDRRRLWLELGHASLFCFLHRELGLSKGAAFYRKTAAELIQRLPEVIEPLRDGRLCLTSIVELSKVVTPENARDVLPRFFHLSKMEAKAISAALSPDRPRRVGTSSRWCALPFPSPRSSRHRLIPGHAPNPSRTSPPRRSCPSATRLGRTFTTCLAGTRAPHVRFIRMNHAVPTCSSRGPPASSRPSRGALRPSRSSRSPPT